MATVRGPDSLPSLFPFRAHAHAASGQRRSRRRSHRGRCDEAWTELGYPHDDGRSVRVQRWRADERAADRFRPVQSHSITVFSAAPVSLARTYTVCKLRVPRTLPTAVDRFSCTQSDQLPNRSRPPPPARTLTASVENSVRTICNSPKRSSARPNVFFLTLQLSPTRAAWYVPSIH